jgi:hypothetical protein
MGNTDGLCDIYSPNKRYKCKTNAMIYINAKYVTLDDESVGVEPERQLTPDEILIVRGMDFYNDVYHYKTIND